MKILSDTAWPFAIAFFYALASFASTRGPDGSPLLALALFPCLGIAYGAAMWRRKESSLGLLAVHLAVFLAATSLPFLVPPRLQEMGSILYYALPVLVCINSVGTALAILVVRPRLARDTVR
jgi:hypothetical protein